MKVEEQKFVSSVQMENLKKPNGDDCGINSADFETAVSATGYGKFHYLLLLSIFLPSWGSAFDTGNMSLILPSAECDLGLSLFHKGMLNAGEFAGMIVSAMLWGFLADTYGRRKLLIYGFFADASCNILSGLAQSFWVLLLFKFVSGCIINGPYAIAMSYCAEFHGIEQRGRAMMLLGLFTSVGNIVLPMLAWIIIPGTWKIVLFDGKFYFSSWHLFLTVSGIPTLIGTIALLYFPESPKFLMSQGKNIEALQIFRKMFAINTGKPPHEYPVNTLEGQSIKRNSTDSISSMTPKAKESSSAWKEIYNGLKQMNPLFHMPHLRNLMLIVFMQFNGMLSMNTIRLWLPQLFATLENFSKHDHGELGLSPTLCEKLDYSTDVAKNTTIYEMINGTSDTSSHHCENIEVDTDVYINSIVIGGASVITFVLAGFFVNVLGKKNMLLISYTVSIVCVLSLNWSSNALLTLILSSLFVSLTNIAVNTLIAVVVETFPTSLSTMTVSLVMMTGRIGSLTGNLMFSILLSVGCIAPFMAISGCLSVCLISSYFIPKPAQPLD